MIVISSSSENLLFTNDLTGEIDFSVELLDWLESNVGCGQVLNFGDVRIRIIRMFLDYGRSWVMYYTWEYDSTSVLKRRADKVYIIFPDRSVDAAMLFKLTWGGS